MLSFLFHWRGGERGSDMFFKEEKKEIKGSNQRSYITLAPSITTCVFSSLVRKIRTIVPKLFLQNCCEDKIRKCM